MAAKLIINAIVSAYTVAFFGCPPDVLIGFDKSGVTSKSATSISGAEKRTRSSLSSSTAKAVSTTRYCRENPVPNPHP